MKKQTHIWCNKISIEKWVVTDTQFQLQELERNVIDGIIILK